jgi:hypothetical protein
MRRPLVCAIIVLVLACRPRGDAPVKLEPPQQPARESTPVVPDSGSLAVPDTANPLLALYDRLRVIGDDRAAIRSRLGEPRTATRETKSNPEDSSTVDTIVRWRYDTLDFTFLLIGHDLLVETRAAADYSPIAPITHALATLDLAQARLGGSQGTLTRGDTTLFVYGVSEPRGGPENSITLHFVKGRLVQIGAVPYID